MGRKAVWNIPVKSGAPGYQKMLAACKHFGKPWDQLTGPEQKWNEKHATKYDPTPKDGPKAYKSKCCGGCRFEEKDCSIRKSVKGEHSCQFKQPLADPPTIPQENRDDLYFLADAMMATCKALEETNGLLRDMLEEAKRERQ